MPPSLPLSSGHMFVEQGSSAGGDVVSSLTPFWKFSAKSRGLRTAAIFFTEKKPQFNFPKYRDNVQMNFPLQISNLFLRTVDVLISPESYPDLVFLSSCTSARMGGEGMEKGGEKSQISARGNWGGGGHSEWKMTYMLRIYCEGLDKLFVYFFQKRNEIKSRVSSTEQFKDAIFFKKKTT